jgi:hypothetical protein
VGRNKRIGKCVANRVVPEDVGCERDAFPRVQNRGEHCGIRLVAPLQQEHAVTREQWVTRYPQAHIG